MFSTAAWNWRFCFLMLFVTVTAFAAGLLSYGPSLTVAYHLKGIYTGKILNGDRLFRQRLRAAEERAALVHRQRLIRIDEALDVIEHADGMLLGEVRAQRAIRGTRLVEQRATRPSLGGVTVQQMQQVEREQASAERVWAAEQASRARWKADREAQVHDLVAGQSPENAARIRATIKSGG